MDIRIELVSVLFNRELLVVINWNEDFLGTFWFLLRVVKLCNIRVCKGFISCKSLTRVELKEALKKVEGFF